MTRSPSRRRTISVSRICGPRICGFSCPARLISEGPLRVVGDVDALGYPQSLVDARNDRSVESEFADELRRERDEFTGDARCGLESGHDVGESCLDTGPGVEAVGQQLVDALQPSEGGGDGRTQLAQFDGQGVGEVFPCAIEKASNRNKGCVVSVRVLSERVDHRA